MFRDFIKTFISAVTIRDSRWAFFNTILSATATLLILASGFYSANQSAFIHHYSSIGILSAWLNNILFFAPLRFPFIYKRSRIFCIYLIAVFIAVLLPTLIFSTTLQTSDIALAAALLAPTLFAPRYGRLFRAQSAQRAYQEMILWNFALVIVVSLCVLLDARALPFGLTLLALCAYLTWLLIPRSTSQQNSSAPMSITLPMYRYFLNPALPVIERTIFHQALLVALAAQMQIFWLYLLGRLVSFIGTLSFSLATQAALGTKSPEFVLRLLPKIILPLYLLPLLFRDPITQIMAACIANEAFGWLLSARLLHTYEENSTRYGKALQWTLIEWLGRLAGCSALWLTTDHEYLWLALSIPGFFVCLKLCEFTFLVQRTRRF